MLMETALASHTMSTDEMRRLSMVRMSILLTLFYSFDTIPVKILASFFVDIDKLTGQYMWEGQGARIHKEILQKETKVQELPFLTSQCAIQR